MSFVGAPAALSLLTGLQRLELRSDALPPDALLHLASLTSLTSLKVECRYAVPPTTDDGVAGGSTPRPHLWAHVGALSGLTRLSVLQLKDSTSYAKEEEVGLLPLPEALLAALPSWPSLTTVGCSGRGSMREGRVSVRLFPPVKFSPSISPALQV